MDFSVLCIVRSIDHTCVHSRVLTLISYIVVELPSNWVLKRIRANRWLSLLVFVWGIVTTLMGLVDSFGSLVAVRVILGFCEGGLLPGMVCDETRNCD